MLEIFDLKKMIMYVHENLSNIIDNFIAQIIYSYCVTKE